MRKETYIKCFKRVTLHQKKTIIRNDSGDSHHKSTKYMRLETYICEQNTFRMCWSLFFMRDLSLFRCVGLISHT